MLRAEHDVACACVGAVCPRIGFLVWFEHTARDINSREDAPRAGVPQHLRAHLCVCRGTCGAAYRTCRDRGIYANRDLVSKQILYAPSVKDE